MKLRLYKTINENIAIDIYYDFGNLNVSYMGIVGKDHRTFIWVPYCRYKYTARKSNIIYSKNISPAEFWS